MSTLTTYWLSRKPGQDAEGPFTLAQLRRMFDSGVLTVESQVCRQGEEDWVSLHEELEFFEQPQQTAAVSTVNEMARQQQILQSYEISKKSESVALLLSVFLPMGGQFYTGRYGLAILGILMMLTIVMFPVAWLCSLFDAVRATRYYNANLWARLNQQP
jgi:hypothetical protein